jgi:hypothetical protein
MTIAKFGQSASERMEYMRHKRATDPAYAERQRRASSDWRKKNPERHRQLSRRWHSENPGRISAARTARTLNISIDLVLTMRRPGNVCEVCGKVPQGKGAQGTLHIDHDHVTGRIRGALCHNCNHAIGQVKDNPDTLRALIAYLERNRA